ncbi:MAG: dTDP-4-dehydrorhamnose reductase [Clostridia bacterium]|nr:dTDP-4-dehydrorhamnose reductase [Clostridia bacterium]
MKILITGVNGQLGFDVARELDLRGIDFCATDITEKYAGITNNDLTNKMSYHKMDITNEKEVEEVFHLVKPDAVIHCAAWTAVDHAEDEENKEKVYNINVVGTRNIAKSAKALDAKMIYISTDYVFNGEGNTPWEPDCKDYDPVSYYGKTKLEGEFEVEKLLTKYFIVRIAWVFGINGKNFIKTILKLSKTKESINVVNDQIGTPTYTYDLSRLLVDMINTEKYGYYHATNEGGFISWYDFTKAICENANLVMKVFPVTTEEYGLNKARRPLNSRLSKDKLVKNGFKPLPTWEEALKHYLKQIDIDNL